MLLATTIGSDMSQPSPGSAAGVIQTITKARDASALPKAGSRAVRWRKAEMINDVI